MRWGWASPPRLSPVEGAAAVWLLSAKAGCRARRMTLRVSGRWPNAFRFDLARDRSRGHAGPAHRDRAAGAGAGAAAAERLRRGLPINLPARACPPRQPSPPRAIILAATRSCRPANREKSCEIRGAGLEARLRRLASVRGTNEACVVYLSDREDEAERSTPDSSSVGSSSASDRPSRGPQVELCRTRPAIAPTTVGARPMTHGPRAAK
jgi:hypothetical protein